MSIINNREDLRAIYSLPKVKALAKEMSILDHFCIQFINTSRFCLLSSSDGATHVDVSPRGGPAGFVKIVDETTLLMADYIGNKRLDSLENILKYPRVGLIFFIPGVDECLRIRAHAAIHTKDSFPKQYPLDQQAPIQTILKFKLDVAYLHCAKALMRSKLWDPNLHIARSNFPTMGEMLKAHTGLASAAESQEAMLKRYHDQLGKEPN